MYDPYRRTPPLSPKGVAEIIAEMESPPADTPERRATFERMRQMRGVRQVSRRGAEDGCEGQALNPYRLTPPLTPEGAREVEEEMARPAADTPQRRATFARARAMAAVRERLAREEAAVKLS